MAVKDAVYYCIVLEDNGFWEDHYFRCPRDMSDGSLENLILRHMGDAYFMVVSLTDLMDFDEDDVEELIDG